MKLPLSVALCVLSLSACAQTAPPDAKAKADQPAAAGETKTAAAPVPNTPEGRARAALQGLDPTIQIDRMTAAPLPGFREAIVGGQVLYVSDDGKYLLQGSLFDMQEKRDLSQIGISVLRRDELAKIPQKDKIVFAPVGKAKHTVNVFTDIECGYCRKLHQDIGEYNRLGIAIQYLAFPRAGTASQDFRNMESVWCSADRRKALTDAKGGQAVAPKTCSNPVNMQYQIGQKIGLQGTPMVVTQEGIALPGYMPPEAMLQTLDRLEAQAKGGAGDAAKATASGAP
ncbi:MAG: thioredoxin fold domain-containing protein [Xanthomonadaceae bacterium]|nr:thioredoxin fold domain-containing protein [Xanthomonadaceae bacterium]